MATLITKSDGVRMASPEERRSSAPQPSSQNKTVTPPPLRVGTASNDSPAGCYCPLLRQLLQEAAAPECLGKSVIGYILGPGCSGSGVLLLVQDHLRAGRFRIGVGHIQRAVVVHRGAELLSVLDPGVLT